MSKLHVTRRELVAAATAGAALAAVPPAWGKTLLSSRARIGPGAFRDGVASGEPDSRSVTFWSRLDTDRPRSGARLVVAKDRGMRKVVATTLVPTGRGVNNVVKARVGGLKPSTEYFYAWESGSDVSPIGRTRTAPSPDSQAPVRMAYSSCQQYSRGYFSAHQHAAGVPDLDLYMFLGDYVYERAHAEVRVDPYDAVDLDSYRNKYRLYRSDPALRELHRLHPTAHVWDDHEVANNYSTNDPPVAAAQRAAAYRAAFEWLPRMTYPRERHRIYKRLGFGDMAEVFLLDERQYRSASLDGRSRGMLGDAQMNWLLERLRTSKAKWKIVAQQVVVATIYYGGAKSNDAWDGYDADRRRILGEIERLGIQDVVFLTGDAHVFMANLLASDFDALAEDPARRPAAIEYVGGSIANPGYDVVETVIQQDAPWNKQYDGSRHGYAYMDLSADRLVTEYRTADVLSPNAPTAPFARFTQPAGTNLLAREAVAPPPRRRAARSRARAR
jgi:phosphodiesterase/alkaline phosphatase D-like protein